MTQVGQIHLLLFVWCLCHWTTGQSQHQGSARDGRGLWDELPGARSSNAVTVPPVPKFGDRTPAPFRLRENLFHSEEDKLSQGNPLTRFKVHRELNKPALTFSSPPRRPASEPATLWSQIDESKEEQERLLGIVEGGDILSPERRSEVLSQISRLVARKRASQLRTEVERPTSEAASEPSHSSSSHSDLLAHELNSETMRVLNRDVLKLRPGPTMPPTHAPRRSFGPQLPPKSHSSYPQESHQFVFKPPASFLLFFCSLGSVTRFRDL